MCRYPPVNREKRGAVIYVRKLTQNENNGSKKVRDLKDPRSEAGEPDQERERGGGEDTELDNSALPCCGALLRCCISTTNRCSLSENVDHLRYSTLQPQIDRHPTDASKRNPNVSMPEVPAMAAGTN